MERALFVYPDAKALFPDPAMIRQHLEWLTAGWEALPEPAMFELRAIAEDVQPHTAKFAPDWMEDAVAWAADMNELGRNLYVTHNPIKQTAGGSAKDADILAAPLVWIDCDDEASAEVTRRFAGPKWAATVRTGQAPETRVHVYWRLAEPCADLAAWTALQKDMAAFFGSDERVVNPSRIMRLGGTVTHPGKAKQARGYVKEFARFNCTYDPPRAPVTLDQMRAAIAARPAPSNVVYPPKFDFDPGPQALDRKAAEAKTLSGEEWHNNMVKLVASHVARGLDDEEIHRLTEHLTQPGYTVEQTRREVQVAIDGARKKGFDQAAKAPDFDAPAKRELTEAERAAIKPADFEPWGWCDLASIPYPIFVYSDFYALGYTSVTIAPPKLGKSLMVMAEAIDMASGRGFLTGRAQPKRRVVYYNAEDDIHVLRSRVAALLTHYGIDQSEIADTLFLVSGVQREDFVLVTGVEGEINEDVFISLEKFVAEHKIEVLIFDPLQDLSHSPETNEVFRLLGQRLRRFASQMSVALGLVHHTRKIAPSVAPTIDDSRGGSALRGTARFNRLLVGMTESEGEKAGIENHRHFFRIGEAESNLAPPSSDINRWFEKVSVQIPNGREVGAVQAWEWPDPFEGMSTDDANAILGKIDQGPPDQPGEKYSARPQDSARFAGRVVVEHWPESDPRRRTPDQAKAIISAWLKAGLLKRSTYRSEAQRKDRQCVITVGRVGEIS